MFGSLAMPLIVMTLVLAILGAFGFMIYRSGKKSVQFEEQKEAADVATKQRDIANGPDDTADDVLKRMRDGKL